MAEQNDHDSNQVAEPKSTLESSLMETVGYLLITDDRKTVLLNEKATLLLQPEALSFTSTSGMTMTVHFREMVKLNIANYSLEIILTNDTILVINKLGYQYEAFCQIFTNLRNAILLTDLLIDDALRLTVPTAFFEYEDPSFQIKQNGRCEIRIYETKLVIISAQSSIVILPFSLIQKIEFNNLAVNIHTESEENLTLNKLGKMYDPFQKAFTEAQSVLQQKVANWLNNTLPDLQAETQLKLSRLIPEGKAAAVGELCREYPSFWNRIQHQMDGSPIREEFNILTAYSKVELIHLGYKRGLWGDWTGDYFWFLFPIADPANGRFKNCFAMETASLTDTQKRATYLFRIQDASDPVNPKANPGQLILRTVKLINRALLSINFRREPIYFDELKLKQPEYLKYRFAIDQLPTLRYLRKLLIGRVTHSTPERWRDEITALINSVTEEV